MGDVVIRRARREDAEALFSLITALAHFEKLPPPDSAARARMLADGWGERPRFQTWLAERDGQAVAYAICFDTYSTFLARPTLYLEDIFVLPEHRGAGIGYAVFRAVARDAVERGCGRMEWCCLDWNQRALDFYDRIGARRLKEWVYFRMLPEEIERLPERPERGDIDAA